MSQVFIPTASLSNFVQGNLQVTGDAAIGGGETVAGGLTVNGNQLIKGNLTVNGTINGGGGGPGTFSSLTVTGSTVLNSFNGTTKIKNSTITGSTGATAIAMPSSTGTLALTSDITGGSLAGSFTTLNSTNSIKGADMNINVINPYGSNNTLNFYGDSFTAGVTTPNFVTNIGSLSGAAVNNYGVSAYTIANLYGQIATNDDGVSNSHVMMGINDIAPGTYASPSLTDQDLSDLRMEMNDTLIKLSIPGSNATQFNTGNPAFTFVGTWGSGTSHGANAVFTSTNGDHVSFNATGRIIFIHAYRFVHGSSNQACNMTISIDGIVVTDCGNIDYATVSLQSIGDTIIPFWYDTGSSASTVHTVLITNEATTGTNLNIESFRTYTPGTTIPRTVYVGQMPTNMRKWTNLTLAVPASNAITVSRLGIIDNQWRDACKYFRNKFSMRTYWLPYSVMDNLTNSDPSSQYHPSVAGNEVYAKQFIDFVTNGIPVEK